MTAAASVLALLMATWQAAPAPAQATVPAGDVERGKKTFNRVGCAECHGGEGQGSPNSGPRLGPNPVPFAGFTAYVRAPKNQMPPYTAKLLSDAELADIYAFLRARPRPISIDATLQR